MSHVDSDIFSSVIYDIGAEYGNTEKIIITRGKIHKYLGMAINYSSPGKVKLSMVSYIGKILGDIPEDMIGESATLDSHHLFDISKDATKLSQTDADIFHHFVGHLLYMSKKGRHKYSWQYHYYTLE